MSDPCIDDFNARITRIQKARSKGYGFEAAGTLGRSFYSRRNRKFRLGFPLLRPVVALLVAGTIVKALFLQQLGTEAYQNRVAEMQAGHGFDRLGGWLMQADPVTRSLADNIAIFLRNYS
jgi:hypothetical protein